MNTKLRFKAYNKSIPQVLVIIHLQENISRYTNNEPKVYKKHIKTYTRHESKEEKAHNQTNQGTDKWRTSSKSKPNQLNSAQNHHGSSLHDHISPPTKDGLDLASPGAAAPGVQPQPDWLRSGQTLVGWLLPPLQQWSHGYCNKTVQFIRAQAE